MAINTLKELKEFNEKITAWIEKAVIEKTKSNDYKTVFLSYGSLSARCKVWSSTDVNVKTVIKRLIALVEKTYHKDRTALDCLKVDIAYGVEKYQWNQLEKIVHSQKHNNHFRQGISFDEKLEVSFLEQEIYGKALIRSVVYNEPNFFDEKNINDAIQKKYNIKKSQISLEKLKEVWVFNTQAVYFENGQLLELHSTGCENGSRTVEVSNKDHIKTLILKNAEFLNNQILENGRFVYGYFPAYDREIKSYNTVRHCTAVYALLETLEVDFNQKYLDNIKVSIQYALDNFYKELKRKAFMIDNIEAEAEIKLGSNAAAIFMLAKYQEITKDNCYQKYAEKLAAGIRFMVDRKGETTHVLEYPSLEVKEKFRIVYYDGEAALGLLRLYQQNKDEKLLKTVKLMFKHFIDKKYDKYHDHWLSYCTNELTIYSPEQEYFEFGLNNYLKHMKFIRDRKTAYSTFLEMMMSAYKMVERIQSQGLDELYEKAKFDQLKELIVGRVEFQRATGFFYPEVAMYMGKPEKVLNAFYVRHDRFRTRIDDQEHNLSGYVAYYNFFEVEKS